MVDESKGLKRVQHGGADTAHRAMLCYYPEIDAGVVTLSNFSNFPATQAANDVTDAFFAEHLEGEADEATPEPEGVEAFDPASYDPAWFEALAGRYELEVMPGFVLSFEERDGAYYTQATGQPEVGMTPIGKARFAIEIASAEIEFHLDDDGTCDTLTLHQNGAHTGTRSAGEKWVPEPAELAVFEGLYFSDELRTVYEVRFDDEGALEINHFRFPDPLPLTPGERDAFSCRFHLASIEFEWDEAGDVVAFIASNGRTRGVRFERMD